MLTVQLLAFVPLIAKALATPAYAGVTIPDSAFIITTFDELHTEAAKFPNLTLEHKYGGYVIEVDGEVKIATSSNMTQQISQKLAELELKGDDDLDENEISKIDKRDCSHPPCFNSALCWSYTDCYVCSRKTTPRGRCI